MRRSSRIASLYGVEWSNLPSMKEQRLTKHAKRAEPAKIMESNTNHRIINVPILGACMVTNDELNQDMCVARYYISQYDESASVIQRVRMMTPLFEYLAERPYFLLIHLGMKWTISHKCQEFKPLIDAHMTRLAEYRAAAKQMEAVLSYGPFMEKGKEILAAGMKAYEEDEEIWNDLKRATDILAMILA